MISFNMKMEKECQKQEINHSFPVFVVKTDWNSHWNQGGDGGDMIL